MRSTVDTRSRRSFLGAGVAAVAATAVSAFARPSQVRAEGENIQVGEEYETATSQTRIRNIANGANVFVVESGNDGTALVGASNTSTGVAGTSGTGTGVYAYSHDGIGLDASSEGTFAVMAQASGNGAVAVHAAANGSGVMALKTKGRISLELSGIATIPEGQTTVVIQFGLQPWEPMYAQITAGSFVLLSPGADIGTRRLWWTKSRIAQTITIHLSSTRTLATKVSWMLLG